MNSLSKSRTSMRHLTAVLGALLALIVAGTAQVKTTTSTEHGTPTKEVKVKRGEVERVSGNDVWIKMENGQIEHFPNVAESTRISVDGREVGIHELKPGMKLEHTTITTTTPRTVTTVETVTGKVWHVNPPKHVILTMENGQNQEFTVPEGQKFTINGQETDVWKLKKGMSVTATRVTEAPETVVERERKLAGTMPPPPPPPVPADTPILIARVEVVHGPGTVVVPAAELPKTGSPIPLIGFLGLLMTGSFACLRLVRR